VDELIFQTYRGKDTLPDIDAYLGQLHELCAKLGDGVNQAADLVSDAASIPSRNFTLGLWPHLAERHEHEHDHSMLDHEHSHVHDEHHHHAHDGPVQDRFSTRRKQCQTTRRRRR
jgi:hypothetical protein